MAALFVVVYVSTDRTFYTKSGTECAGRERITSTGIGGRGVLYYYIHSPALSRGHRRRPSRVCCSSSVYRYRFPFHNSKDAFVHDHSRQTLVSKRAARFYILYTLIIIIIIIYYSVQLHRDKAVTKKKKLILCTGTVTCSLSEFKRPVENNIE